MAKKSKMPKTSVGAVSEQKPVDGPAISYSTSGGSIDFSPLPEDYIRNLERRMGEGLFESFQVFGNGVLSAIGETRKAVDTLKVDLRAQSLDTGEAVGKAAGLADALQRLQTELNDRLSEQQLQAQIERAAQRATAQIEAEISERLGQLAASQSALQEKYERTLREQGFLEDLLDENVQIVTRYRPGQIEVLEQKLQEAESDKKQLNDRLKDTLNKLDDAERDNMRLRSRDDIVEREDIEKKLEALTRLRHEHVAFERLAAERNDLQSRLDELEQLRSLYEAHQDVVERDRHLELELVTERTRRAEIEERYRNEKQNRTEASRSAERLRTHVETLRKRCEGPETNVAELELELDAYRAREAELGTKRDEYLDKLQELKTRRQEIEQELADRAEARNKQDEHSLESERKQLRPVLERELQRKYQAQLEELERLRHVEQKLEDLRKVYRTATEETVAWARERSMREAQKSAEVERIQRLQDEVVELDENRKEAREGLAKLQQDLALREVARVELEAQIAQAQERHQRMAGELEAEYEKRRERLEEQYSERQSELDVDRDTRIAPIHVDIFKREGTKPTEPGITEAKWLDGVVERIEQAEFHFPRRLIEAFHTSLKIATWAPLTVLAGVSGTGKSELPRLYSMFGGLHYQMLSVQPNWDSPQDLFGFFNYMDNKYKATELLRGLVQSRKEAEDGGVSDQLVLVLLDEMNLARVELYFSEFLSKLEARRGIDGDRTPYIGVDIGSGLPEEQVMLGSNVLFVGTMNEDETTNALSDKVLDRGNVITFPRPTNLLSRALRGSLQPIPERLPLDVWQGWVVPPESMPAEVRGEIREFMNGINVGLSHVHRAVGHRVLQAVENYVANHPAVRASDVSKSDDAWRRALGDQVVQKIMPKLRGVETDTQRGRACLGEVGSLLELHTPELSQDFRAAREAGYGSFIWSSANYLTAK